MAVRVQEDPIDIGAEITSLTAGKVEIGAVASFIGKVRGAGGGDAISAMTLEHYPGMTESELAAIEAEACHRFNLSESLIVHRVGTLKPGDDIVLVIACSPHRRDAFEACEFLMDYLKTRAPFWKKESGADGESRWVDARCEDDAATERWRR
jgi:molybdopterin synthase catalytic subunit